MRINVNMSYYISSQRWFRNARRRLNNSIRRESRGETSENRRCYVPMTQTPLTPAFIRDIPAPMRRILQVSQNNNARCSSVASSTGQIRHYRWESLTEAAGYLLPGSDTAGCGFGGANDMSSRFRPTFRGNIIHTIFSEK